MASNQPAAAWKLVVCRQPLTDNVELELEIQAERSQKRNMGGKEWGKGGAKETAVSLSQVCRQLHLLIKPNEVNAAYT